MPLKLIPPREGKTPYWYIRGSYMRVRVYESCGTPKRSVAAAYLKRREESIERGEYPAKPVAPAEPTFVDAAVRYLETGHRKRYVARLIKHFGTTPLREIDQEAIDRAAIMLHPSAGPGTRNAAVYTPVSAILRHAGVVLNLRRPKGAKGRERKDWLSPQDAAGISRAAWSFDPEYGLFLDFLLYTGLRLNEALSLTWDALRIEGTNAWVRRQKGGPEGAIFLRAGLRTALEVHRRAIEGRSKVFRFRAGGHLKHLLTRAKLGALGVPCPVRRPKGWKQPDNRLKAVNHHTYRHTFATWMRTYGGVDERGLIATGNWTDRRSASRYAHAVPAAEWSRVADLPDIADDRWRMRGLPAPSDVSD